MCKRFSIYILTTATLLAFSSVHAEDDVLQRALRDELVRSMQQLQLEDLEQPYFVSYLVREVKSKGSAATFGSLLNSGEGHSRELSVEVRVGDYDLDNTNFRSFSFGGTGVVRMYGGSMRLPLEDDYDELRRKIWLATDGAYKKALEDIARKRATLQNKTRTEEIPDFSREKPTTEVEEMAPAVLELDELDQRVRQLSDLFRAMPDIYTSRVRLNGANTSVRYLNSEGSSFSRTSSSLTFTAVAATQAPDGMPLEDFVAVYARSPEDLPSDDELGRADQCHGRASEAVAPGTAGRALYRPRDLRGSGGHGAVQSGVCAQPASDAPGAVRQSAIRALLPPEEGKPFPRQDWRARPARIPQRARRAAHGRV